MRRKADFKLQKVGDDHLLVPLGAQVRSLNGIITLNETAAWVWERLAEEQSRDELIAAVMEQFEVTAESARAEVLSFVDEIARMGLVEP